MGKTRGSRLRNSQRNSKKKKQIGGSTCIAPTDGHPTLGVGSFIDDRAFLTSFPYATLVAWFDAKDPNGNGNPAGDGSVIGTWVDKSGNGNHLNQWNGTQTYYRRNLSTYVASADKTRVLPLLNPYQYPTMDFSVINGNRGGVFSSGKSISMSPNMSVFVVGVFNNAISPSWWNTCSSGTFFGHFPGGNGDHDYKAVNVRRYGGNNRLSVSYSGGDTLQTTPFNVTNTDMPGAPNGQSSAGAAGYIKSIPFIMAFTVHGNNLYSYRWQQGTNNTVFSNQISSPNAAHMCNVNAPLWAGGSGAQGGAEYCISHISEIIYYNTPCSATGGLCPQDTMAVAGFLAWKWGFQTGNNQGVLNSNGAYYTGPPITTPTVSAAKAAAAQASAAVASAAQQAVAIASSARVVAAQASAAAASAAQASAIMPSVAQASAAQAAAFQNSAARASAAGVSAASASAASASAASVSAALASAAQASAGLASTARASSARASAAIASSANASTARVVAEQLLDATASAAQASMQMASAARASGQIASSARSSAAQASAATVSAARASAGQASAALGSAAQASAQQVSAALASAGQASSANASLALASAALASGQLASAARQSSAVAAAAIASAATANAQLNSAAYAAAQQVSAATASAQKASAGEASAALASAGQAAALQASAALASAGQASSALASAASASAASASAALASAAIQSSAVAAAAIASAAVANAKLNSAAYAAAQQVSAATASSQQASAGQQSAAMGSAAQASAVQASAALASAARASSALASAGQASAGQASSAIASAARAAVAQASAAIASAGQASAASASAAQASAGQASSAIASAGQAAAAQESASIASAAQAYAQQNSAALAALKQASAAVASGQQASAAQASTAVASAAQASAASASAAQLSSARQSSAVAAAAIASAAQAYAHQNSAALASAQQAAFDQFSAAKASSQQASSAQASAAQASGSLASSAQASAAQAYAHQNSAAIASAQQAAAGQYSAALASSQQASAAQASSAQSSGSLASSARASAAQASAAMASAAMAFDVEASAARTSAAQASSAQASSSLASSAKVSAAQAFYAQASAAVASAGQASAAQASSSLASAAQASSSVDSSAQASAAQASSAKVSSAQAAVAQASSAVASAAQASAAQASSSLGSAARASSSVASAAQASAAIQSAAQAAAGQYSAAVASAAQASAGQVSSAQASAAQGSSAQASSAGASAGQASSAQASSAQASAGQQSAAQASAAQASAAVASAGQASAGQASAAIASTAQALVASGDDPTNGRFVLPTTDLDQTIVTNQFAGRYIRIMPSTNAGDGFIHLSQIIVYDVTGSVISTGVPVYQTSVIKSAQPATTLVDGTQATRPFPNVWHSATNNRATEFVELDLGSLQSIDSIRILGRSDCPMTYKTCNQRMLRLRIQINTDTTPAIKNFYTVQAAAAEASAAQASAAKASASIGAEQMALNAKLASVAKASAATASAAQAASQEESAAKSSAAQASTAQASAVQASAIAAMSLEDSAALAAKTQASAAEASNAAALQVSTAKASAAQASAATFLQASAATASAAQASAAQASAAVASAAQARIDMGDDPINGKFILPSLRTDQTIVTKHFMGRYVRVRPAFNEGDGYLNLSQIIVYNVLGKNISLGAQTFATSTMDGAGSPSVLVDGSVIVRGLPNVWSSQTDDRGEFVELDLGSVQAISAVRILGTSNCEIDNMCQKRMYQVRVEINKETTDEATINYMQQLDFITTSAANASAAKASAAQASAAKASAEQAAILQESAAKAAALQTSAATSSAAQASAAIASAAIEFNRLSDIENGSDPANGKYILPTNDTVQVVKTNGIQGRFVRLKPSLKGGDGWIHLSQVIVKNRSQYNIARNRPVFATSTIRGGADSTVVVDGTLSPRNFPQIWQSKSGNRNEEFLEIDLGSIQAISSIEVIGRYNCNSNQTCMDRMLGLRIEVNEDSPLAPDDIPPEYADDYTQQGGNFSFSQSGGALLKDPTLQSQIIPTNGFIGQYVRIMPPKISGDGYMHFSQIMIYNVLGLNIATGKQIYASSTMKGAANPKILVDGSKHVRGLPNLWHTATPNRNTEFIEINLGKPQAISAIRLLGRSDCHMNAMCRKRMIGLRVQINSETTGEVEEAQTPASIRPTATIVPMASTPLALTPAALTVQASAAQGPRTITISGSTNSSDSIQVSKPSNFMPVLTPDPSLPNGYERVWDRRLRKYAYQYQNEIVPHPQPPSKRIDHSYIQRPEGIPTVTRQEEAKLLNLTPAQQGGGVKPFVTDIQIITDPTLSSPWQKYFDTGIRKYYYFAGEDESWEHPFTPRRPIVGEMKYGDSGLPDGWDKYLDSAKNKYFYYYPGTGETTWDHPNPPPFPRGLDLIPNEHISDLYAQYRDPATQQIFYFNTLTTETFWVLPHGVAGVGSVPGASSNPIEIFACQRINVVSPGTVRTGPSAAIATASAATSMVFESESTESGASESGPSESGASESGASGSETESKTELKIEEPEETELKTELKTEEPESKTEEPESKTEEPEASGSSGASGSSEASGSSGASGS